MPVLTPPAAEQLERAATVLGATDIAAYLQSTLGQRIAAHAAGLADSRQIGRYAKADGPRPSATTDRRMREAYKIVRMITEAYDGPTTRAWLFGTNSRLDDQAPIEVLGQATETKQFASVVRAARQFASFQ